MCSEQLISSAAGTRDSRGSRTAAAGESSRSEAASDWAAEASFQRQAAASSHLVVAAGDNTSEASFHQVAEEDSSMHREAAEASSLAAEGSSSRTGPLAAANGVDGRFRGSGRAWARAGDPAWPFRQTPGASRSLAGPLPQRRGPRPRDHRGQSTIASQRRIHATIHLWGL